MSKEVIIAILSAVVGMISAIIAYIQSLRTARLKAQSDLVLEKIKSDAQLRKEAFDIARQESAPIEAALAQAWEDIQVIKETIFKLMGPVRYDADIALESINPSVKRLVEGYAKFGSDLPQVADKAWHSAKSSALGVESLITEYKLQKKRSLDFPPEVAANIREIRSTLTDCQMALAAARQHIREQMLERILRIL